MRLLAMMVGLLAALAAAEFGLRAFHYSFAVYPKSVEFGWPDPVMMENLFTPDEQLLWVPHEPVRYGAILQRLRETPPDIVFMGDSCTQWGKYDRDLIELIEQRHPGKTSRGVNVGVAGWSSYQGLQQLQRDVLGARPKVITIYFGWNDHWIGLGVQDKQAADVAASPLLAFRWFRVAQLLTQVQLAIKKQLNPEQPQRVAPEDFRANLTQMVRRARTAGIEPVLLTAPTSHRPGKEPPYLAERHLRKLSDLVPLHQRYAAIVREVAENEKVILADLEREFAKIQYEQLAGEYFDPDGIHLHEAGDRKIAELLYACFEEHGLLERVVRDR